LSNEKSHIASVLVELMGHSVVEPFHAHLESSVFVK